MWLQSFMMPIHLPVRTMPEALVSVPPAGHSRRLRDCLAKRTPGSVEVKVVGELVYRYESATSSETKALIAKAGAGSSKLYN